MHATKAKEAFSTGLTTTGSVIGVNVQIDANEWRN